MPCGIYDDEARFKLLAEDVTTIEKAMKEITDLSAAGDKNYNQLVRWINTKDEHATKFQRIIADYFLTQRIKPIAATDTAKYAEYQSMVELCHQLMVEAMKCKQTTDLSHPAKLTELIAAFKKVYNGKHGHHH
ncbi:MAG: superoxide dismutase [Candidatus Zixiibacteriota bacterium]|nr:MAG: superoxide dismutase [candidate division Zixibacteria bacterium]